MASTLRLFGGVTMGAVPNQRSKDVHSLSLRLPHDLAAAARQRAVEEDRNLNQLIRRALRQYLASADGPARA